MASYTGSYFFPSSGNSPIRSRSTRSTGSSTSTAPTCLGRRSAHSAERRARALLASGQVRDPARLRRTPPRHRPSRDGRHRRRVGVHQSGEGGLAWNPGPKMPLPRVLPGETLHDLHTEAPGGSGARSSLTTDCGSPGGPSRRSSTTGRSSPASTPVSLRKGPGAVKNMVHFRQPNRPAIQHGHPSSSVMSK